MLDGPIGCRVQYAWDGISKIGNELAFSFAHDEKMSDIKKVDS